LEWYITVISILVSWIFFTIILNWLGKFAAQFLTHSCKGTILANTQFRYDCLQYFTFLTNQGQCNAFGLPFVNIEIPENCKFLCYFLLTGVVIAWVKLREYLQTIYPINIRDFEVLCSGIVVYLFGLSAVIYLQLFRLYFTSFFLVCVYDLFVLGNNRIVSIFLTVSGLYLLALLSLGVNINQLTQNHKTLLASTRVTFHHSLLLT
jgi:hypothetical protein